MDLGGLIGRPVIVHVHILLEAYAGVHITQVSRPVAAYLTITAPRDGKLSGVFVSGDSTATR